MAFGIAQNIGNLPPDRELKKRIDTVGNEPEYKTATAAGKNANFRIPKLLALGKRHFKNG